MTDTAQNAQSDPIRDDRRKYRRYTVVAFGCLLLIGLGLTALIVNYADNERQRLREDWFDRIGVVADSRRAAVEGWLTQRRNEALKLSGHRAVQFYMVDRADPEVPREAVDGQLIYVEELLGDEAVRAGYGGVDEEGRQLPGGVLLLDAEGLVLTATTAAPLLEAAPFDAGQLAARGAAVSPVFDVDGAPMIAIRAAVPAIEAGAAPLGQIIAFRRLDDDFRGLLDQPGEDPATSATWLIQSGGAELRMIGRSGAEHSDAAMAALAGQPRGAGVYDANIGRVIAVGRQVTDMPWTVIRAVDRDRALADDEARIRLVQIVSLLGVALFALGILVAWRFAVSHRLDRASRQIAASRDETDRLNRLLQRLINAVPAGILALGTDERVRFANRHAVATAAIEPEDAVGKDLIGIFGPGRAEPLMEANAEARRDGETVWKTDDINEADGRHVVRRSHVPLDDDGVLLVSEDMTDIVVEREARAAQLDALVNVLVDLIDARDKYAASHSRRVARLSRRMAEQLSLSETEAAAAETAARLMNLGKLKIDPELLTRDGNLSEDERAQVRDSMLASADIVEGVAFDGPVVNTLRQLRERFDGGGEPAGIGGADLLVTAQIVSLANAYVAMISDRAHRAALPKQEALEQLWTQAGKVWDHTVVAALVNSTGAADRT
ncbi:MAG: HD-GYP domain-containing protein [Minwuia sp.]|uniref:HD-GYP domain-containing protein n=1 Tax=Minwuia sp. TaxID=2493630 RepID=UPI003A89D3E8